MGYPIFRQSGFQEGRNPVLWHYKKTSPRLKGLPSHIPVIYGCGSKWKTINGTTDVKV